MTAAAMLAQARHDLGMTGRPNRITRSYASRHGDVFLTAAWCDQGITTWARESGNADAVLPAGDRAYTVWHAEDGHRAGRWWPGTAENLRKHAKPGAVVFFDWQGRDAIGAIDHVGLIERVLSDGRVQTIEANTGDGVRRRVRSAAVIAGFFNPAYGAAKKKPKPIKVVVKDGVPQWPGRVLKLADPYMTGEDVEVWQGKMAKRGWRITVDGEFGPQSRAVCRSFRKATGLPAGDVVDLDAWVMTWSWRPPAVDPAAS